LKAVEEKETLFVRRQDSVKSPKIMRKFEKLQTSYCTTNIALDFGTSSPTYIPVHFEFETEA
jgi:hypothetical protein